MAKQAPPAAAEPAAKGPAAEPAASQPAPSVEELQAKLAELDAELKFQRELVASKDASLEELASKLVDARDAAAKADANAQRIIELEGLVSARSAAIDDLEFKLAEAHEKIEQSARREPEPEPEPAPALPAVAPPELHADQAYRCVALRKMRAPDGWVSAGAEFEAMGAQLEGYSHGEHFVTKD